MPLSSSAITTYSLAGGIDFRSGSPVALDGSQTGLTVDSANVTDGVFNGTSSWASLAGLTLGNVACVTAAVNATNPDQYAMLWEFSPDTGSNSGFYVIDDRSDANHILRLAANGGSGNSNLQLLINWNSGGDNTIATQFNISGNPYLFEATKNGGTPDSNSAANVAGTFGTRTLYIGARNAGSLWLAGTISFLLVHDAWQTNTLKTNLAADIYAVLSSGTAHKPQLTTVGAGD